MSGDVEKLREPIRALTQALAAAGKSAPQVVPLMQLALASPDQAAAQLRDLAAIGVTGISHTARYENVDEFARMATALVAARQRAELA